MPTWEETVLANDVDALWRLDELSDEHGTLPDASGNGNHATCYAEDPDPPGQHVHGFASPIETDASSRAILGRAGTWIDTIGRLNTFHWGVWGYNADTDSPQTLICRSGHWSNSGSNILGFSGGAANAEGRLRVGGVNYELSAPVLTGVWYYLGLNYNAGVVQLRINGAMVAQETGVSGDMDVGSSTKFYLGAMHTDEGIWNSSGIDEPHIGIALSEAQSIENYESALNELLLRGYSNVIPTAILYSDIEPDPISFPFRHNWSDSLIERISFRTNISTARKGTEASNAVWPKPRREIEISQVLRDDAERRKLRAKLSANQNRKWFIPILEDREQLIAPLALGETVIPATIQYRDYEVDSWLELRQLNDAGQVIKSEHAQIATLSPLTITAPTVNAYDAYLSTVSPVRRAIVNASIPVRGHTDAVEDLTITARLVAEDESATPNRITAWTPLTIYKGYEVHDPAVWQSNDWTELREYDIDRDVQDVDFDAGSFSPQSDTLGAAEATSYRMVLEGRDKQAALLGWFYYRAGSLIYLWVPTMQKDFAVVSVLGSDLTVSGHEYSENYAGSEARRDLAFVYHDNTMILRRINSVVLVGVNETLTLDLAVPTQTNLRSVSFLKFCRLDADTLEISRITDNKARFAWRFREILSSPS